MVRWAWILFAGWIASSSSFGQDAAKVFTVRWHGQSFFQVVTPSGKRIVFDPHFIPEFGRPEVKADIILASHAHNDHNQVAGVEDGAKVKLLQGVNQPDLKKSGEWVSIDEKIDGIRYRTVGVYHDNENGLQRGKNSIFVVEAEGLTFCHLGDLGHELSAKQVELIGKVDVLMVPVGGIYTINGETAWKVVQSIKPRLYVLPMHYAVKGYEDTLLGPAEFLLDAENVKKVENTNLLSIPSDMTAKEPTVLLLNWKVEETPDKQ